MKALLKTNYVPKSYSSFVDDDSNIFLGKDYVVYN